MPMPAKFIRYIYNRTILENAPVRAAAVAALAKFATALGGEIRSNVKVLIQRCQDDPDDEVRDRSIMYLHLLEMEETKELAEKYIADGKFKLQTIILMILFSNQPRLYF
jgi:coatomer protein complex subunit gamma